MEALTGLAFFIGGYVAGWLGAIAWYGERCHILAWMIRRRGG